MKSETVVSAYRQLRSRLMTEMVITDGPAIIVFVGRNDETDSHRVALDFARTCQQSDSGEVLFVSGADASEHCSQGVLLDQKLANQLVRNERSDAGMVFDTDKPGLKCLRVMNSDVPRRPDWEEIRAKLVAVFTTVIVDARNLASMDLVFWRPIANRTILVVDSVNTTIAELERLRSELDTGRINIDGAVLSQKQFYVPEWIYRRLW